MPCALWGELITPYLIATNTYGICAKGLKRYLISVQTNRVGRRDHGSHRHRCGHHQSRHRHHCRRHFHHRSHRHRRCCGCRRRSRHGDHGPTCCLRWYASDQADRLGRDGALGPDHPSRLNGCDRVGRRRSRRCYFRYRFRNCYRRRCRHHNHHLHCPHRSHRRLPVHRRDR